MSSMAVKRRPSLFLEIEKSHTEPCLANMEAGASLQYCFRPKIHEQAMKCEQVHYRGGKVMNCFSINPGIFFRLLHANGFKLVGSTPYW